jgi:hypothetical protein
MSNTANSLTALSRRTWIALVVADLVLFLLANLTAKHSSQPGTVSNAFFVAFVIGVVLLIALAIAGLIGSRRGGSR